MRRTAKKGEGLGVAAGIKLLLKRPHILNAEA
jgi:hypothetical protein